jgi:hypothetical protein
MNYWLKPLGGGGARLAASPVMASFPVWLRLAHGRMESRNRAFG